VLFLEKSTVKLIDLDTHVTREGLKVRNEKALETGARPCATRAGHLRVISDALPAS
jgi:hypothetical protein